MPSSDKYSATTNQLHFKQHGFQRNQCMPASLTPTCQFNQEDVVRTCNEHHRIDWEQLQPSCLSPPHYSTMCSHTTTPQWQPPITHTPTHPTSILQKGSSIHVHNTYPSKLLTHPPMSLSKNLTPQSLPFLLENIPQEGQSDQPPQCYSQKPLLNFCHLHYPHKIHTPWPCCITHHHQNNTNRISKHHSTPFLRRVGGACRPSSFASLIATKSYWMCEDVVHLSP